MSTSTMMQMMMKISTATINLGRWIRTDSPQQTMTTRPAVPVQVSKYVGTTMIDSAAH